MYNCKKVYPSFRVQRNAFWITFLLSLSEATENIDIPDLSEATENIDIPNLNEVTENIDIPEVPAAQEKEFTPTFTVVEKTLLKKLLF